MNQIGRAESQTDSAGAGMDTGRARAPYANMHQPPHRSPALLMNSSRVVVGETSALGIRPGDGAIPTSELLASQPEQPPIRPQNAVLIEKAEPVKKDRYSPSNAIYLRLSGYQRFGDVRCSAEKTSAQLISLLTAESSGAGSTGRQLDALNALRAHKSPESLTELSQSIKQHSTVLLKNVESQRERRVEACVADSFSEYERLFDQATSRKKVITGASQETPAKKAIAEGKRDQQVVSQAIKQPDCKQAFQKTISAAPSHPSKARSGREDATQKAAHQKPALLTREQIAQKAAESLQRQQKAEQGGSAGYASRPHQAARDRFVERQLSSPIGDERIIARTDRTTGVTTYQNTPRVEMSVLAQRLGVK